jgi:hypothetical protein
MPLPTRKVLLFSGHMIDGPQRQAPRFPESAVPVARRAIAARLDELDAGPLDLAICSGACGGDLLFAEAALQRDMRVEIYLPFDEATFTAASVDFAGSSWRALFEEVTSRGALHLMPDEREPVPEDRDPYEMNNLWMLEVAAGYGAERIEFICLWNGEEGDGPGGTAHMMREVERLGGRVHWLRTGELWG